MVDKRKINQVVTYTLLLLVFFGLKILDFTFIDYILLSIVFIFALPTIKTQGTYATVIRLYCFLVLASCVYSWKFNGQALYSVIGHSYDYFALLFFFVLIRVNLTSKETMKVMEILALMFCIGYIIQWLIHPIIIFSQAGKFVSDDSYRARMSGSICCYFMLMYAINNYLLHRKGKYLLYGVLAFIPIIMQGFRSLTALSAVASFLMIPFVLRNGRKTILYSILGIGLVIVALSTSMVQSKMNEMMKRQESNQTFDNENYVRFRSFDYYWNQQFTKPYEKLIGGGRPVDIASRYYKNITNKRLEEGLFWTDLGIVGLSMIIGIPAVLLLIFLYLRCIWRCKEPQIQFVRFTLFLELVGSIFTTAELYREGNILLLSFFLYLEYKYHREQEFLEVNKNN